MFCSQKPESNLTLKQRLLRGRVAGASGLEHQWTAGVPHPQSSSQLESVHLTRGHRTLCWVGAGVGPELLAPTLPPREDAAHELRP